MYAYIHYSKVCIYIYTHLEVCMPSVHLFVSLWVYMLARSRAQRSGLMRLRGDLHKVDLVIAQMGLENLQTLTPTSFQLIQVRSRNAQGTGQQTHEDPH